FGWQPVHPAIQGTGIKATVQRIGGRLAAMVMPDIGAFIAWGLITALFIPTGWLPNARYATLVGPMITGLLPVLIGYTGGRAVHGQRGAVVGAVATMGIVIGSDVPMYQPSPQRVSGDFNIDGTSYDFNIRDHCKRAVLLRSQFGVPLRTGHHGPGRRG